ncbi:MAG: GNAT family N-acetyltransferase [Candidatus Bathyarchaeota archaeon]|nr:GNAT family N-acetyltransferase [Candidatus Bathyarchaeota archaeon]
MNEEYLENSTNEAIVETQEESEEDDEVIFKLFVNGEIVSWAKTLLYSYLKEIHTAVGEKRKGYSRKLLSHIEKIARAHGATTMKVYYADAWSDEATVFFRRMGYGISPVENGASRFLETNKKL